MSTLNPFTRAGLFTTLALLFSVISRADMSDADYQAALKLAQKKVARTQRLSTNALLPSRLRTLLGRMYEVGDRWDVAAWSFRNTMARMTADPAKLQMQGGRGGVFRYEVTEVKNSPELQVTLQITQLEEFGVRKPDPRVRVLRLIETDRMVQTKKTYQIEDHAGRPHWISVSPDGIHSDLSSLELFALDVPELTTAEAARAQAIPSLPEGLASVASQAGYHPDPAKCVLFEQDDFFGRGIQAIWQQGDPWPVYLKTSNGVSILIRRSGGSGNSGGAS